MTAFTRIAPGELERRRALSIKALENIDREKFVAWYQEECDRLYWKLGKCCAGCDHWQSNAGLTGNCSAAGIVSGADVIRSMGVEFSSYTPSPGLPYSKASFYCGKFKDNFDWSSLPHKYLNSIGAVRGGNLRGKPENPTPDTGDTP